VHTAGLGGSILLLATIVSGSVWAYRLYARNNVPTHKPEEHKNSDAPGGRET